jgi:hypothetical protein
MMQDPWWSRDPVTRPAQPQAAQPQAAQTPFWANDPVVQDPAAQPRTQPRPQQTVAAPQAAPAPTSQIAAPTVSGLSLDESVQAFMEQGYSAPRALELAQEQQQRDMVKQQALPAATAPVAAVAPAPAQPRRFRDLSPDDRMSLQRGDELIFDLPGGGEEVRRVAAPTSVGLTEGREVSPGVYVRDVNPDALAEVERLLGDQRSPGASGMRELMQGLSFSLSDELEAAFVEAQARGENLNRRILGEEMPYTSRELGDLYVEALRGEQGQFRKRRPVTSTALNLIGGLGVPGGGAAGRFIQGGEGAGRIARAGAVGGGYGAAYGAGGAEGSLVDRAPEAAMGGLVGAGGGAVVQGGMNAGGAGLRALGARNAQRAAGRTPEGRVRGVLARALERDTITPQDYLASLDQAVPGQLPFERGGENLVGLAEVAAQSPGPSRAELTKALRDRSDTATNRISERLGEAFGAEGNSIQNIRNRVKERGDAAAAGMAQFGDRPVALDDNAILALRQSLASKAVREEAVNAAAELTPEGSAAANRLFNLTDDALDNPAAAQMTIREAQDVSYALKEAASRAYRGGFNTRGAALQRASDAIRGAARQDGDYAAWLDEFGDASEVIDALRKGRNVFAGATEKNAMSAAELREAWPTLSEGARENFRLGVGEAILDRARSQGGITAMRRLLKDREIADRVRVAFGSDDAFESFMRGAADEVGMQDVANQVLGGSPTARRAAGAADLNAQEGSPVLDTIGMLAGDVSSGTALARRGVREVLSRIPRKDRSVLGDRETNALLAQALRDPDFVRQLLSDVPGATTQDASRLARALANRPRGSVTGQSAAALSQVLAPSSTQEPRRAQQ